VRQRSFQRTSANNEKQHVRCAIYTRKSTEEGLDQEFNSLDAQHEACAAYVLSQRQEGWSLLPTRYDDGAYSGGNMARPGLQRLLAEVRAGKVDVIIVYKVDRLTRSLTDFAKIVEALDGAGASFVSITQSFNTTTSMGRLTLNVLLSFAQFEREVISERVRDKVAASKAKGMWMGGPVPLGYAAVDRKLVVNQAEAETIRFIMRRYLELGSVRELMVDLEQHGVRTKVQQMRDGSTRGGLSFTRGPLYHLLKNRIYIGRIVHHEKTYPGEHQPIVNEQLFEAVQNTLAARGAEQKRGRGSAHQSLLAGMIRDAEDRPMTPVHATKGNKRYRYYASNVAVPGDLETASPATRVPAAELEAAIRAAVADVLEKAEFVRARSGESSAAAMRSALSASKQLAHRVRDEPVCLCRAHLRKLDLQTVVERESIIATCSARRLMEGLGMSSSTDDQRLTVPIFMRTVRRGSELRLIFAAPRGSELRRDPRLIATIIEAHRARDELIEMDAYLDAERKRELTRVARLSYLAPDILGRILDGQQPDEFGTRKLKRISHLPLCWQEQRALLGFG
jgi:DNA invertase Pin-like site-specific DNA recombinase